MGLLNDICKDQNIKLIAFTDELGEILMKNANTVGQGLAVNQDDNKYIFFDETSTIWEKRFTVAHEAAHHLLEHLRPNTNIDPKDRENEANIFAAVIVALLLFNEYEK